MFSTQLQMYTEVFEAENELAKVAGYEYVEALKPVFLELSYRSPEPGSEMYKIYLHDATMMILSGAEPVDVLNYYDRKIQRVDRS